MTQDPASPIAQAELPDFPVRAESDGSGPVPLTDPTLSDRLITNTSSVHGPHDADHDDIRSHARFFGLLFLAVVALIVGFVCWALKGHAADIARFFGGEW